MNDEGGEGEDVGLQENEQADKGGEDEAVQENEPE